MYTGFPHDRRFMLYNVAKDKNMHIAEFTEMCLFTTSFDDNAAPTKVVVSYAKDHVVGKPDVKIADAANLVLDLDPDTSGLSEFEITMHSSPVVGFDLGEKVNAWFSDRFGYAVKLLYIGGNRRKVLGNLPPVVAGQQRDGQSENSANGKASGSWFGSITSTASALVNSVVGKRYEGEDVGISFADVAPYLVVSEKSWENVQRRLDGTGETMDISKFRPNIIVAGAEEEWDEDFWAELVIGNQAAKIVLTQNCARCNSLNVDYATGKVGEGEAGKILKKLNSDRRVDPGAKWSPVFGRYGFLAKVPEGKEAAVISVGDEVEVVRRNSARTEFGECDNTIPSCGGDFADKLSSTEWPKLSTNNK